MHSNGYVPLKSDFLISRCCLFACIIGWLCWIAHIKLEDFNYLSINSLMATVLDFCVPLCLGPQVTFSYSR